MRGKDRLSPFQRSMPGGGFNESVGLAVSVVEFIWLGGLIGGVCFGGRCSRVVFFIAVQNRQATDNRFYPYFSMLVCGFSVFLCGIL
jgi:hypothetical protein